MKKIFILCILSISVFFSSCMTSTTCIGNITAYNSDGSVLKKWDNVVIEEKTNNEKQSSFKHFGVNFYDKASGKNIIIGNSVPVIIEYNVSQYTSSAFNNMTSVNIPYNLTHEQQEQYISEYKELEKEQERLNKEIKHLTKNKIDCRELKERKKLVSKRKNELSNIFFYRNIVVK